MTDTLRRYWVRNYELRDLGSWPEQQVSREHDPVGPGTPKQVYLAADVEAVEQKCEGLRAEVQMADDYKMAAFREYFKALNLDWNEYDKKCSTVILAIDDLKHALAAKEAEVARYRGSQHVLIEERQAPWDTRDTLHAELDRYQTAIRQGLWGDTTPDEPHGKEIFVIRREVVKLHAELARVRKILDTPVEPVVTIEADGRVTVPVETYQSAQAHTTALRGALEWADNELSHSQDETSCCYKWCEACKKTMKNPVWKKWWQDDFNPITAALQPSRGEQG